mmetsp:Transcript_46653/g.146640  ORF Transcript_46653/g.146640 Transcript_46653/m.146640 type:complete len:277 (+) Transcript_46653:194-1024(+)
MRPSPKQATWHDSLTHLSDNHAHLYAPRGASRLLPRGRRRRVQREEGPLLLRPRRRRVGAHRIDSPVVQDAEAKQLGQPEGVAGVCVRLCRRVERREIKVVEVWRQPLKVKGTGRQRRQIGRGRERQNPGVAEGRGSGEPVCRVPPQQLAKEVEPAGRAAGKRVGPSAGREGRHPPEEAHRAAVLNGAQRALARAAELRVDRAQHLHVVAARKQRRAAYQLAQDAPRRPEVDGRAVPPVAAEQLWRAIPARDRVGREETTLVVLVAADRGRRGSGL